MNYIELNSLVLQLCSRQAKDVVSVSKVYDTNGKLSESDKETAQILCDQFQQVFTTREHSNLVNLVSESSHELSVAQLFTESIVYKKLCMLNVTKSPSPDAVPPHLFKKLW